MRCLYCGKELALLKRLTGGEFCSDAHRLQYKEEYNQLALNRLLQAKSKPEEEGSAVAAKAFPSNSQNRPAIDESDGHPPTQPPPTHRGTPETPEPADVEFATPHQEVASEIEPATKAHAGAASLAPQSAEPAAAENSPQEPAPAEQMGFLPDLPVPVMAEVAKMAVPETDLQHHPNPSLPVRDPEVLEAQLFEAGQVAIEPSARLRDYASRRSERGPEIREFGRSAPAIEMSWPSADAGTLETSEEPMEILIFPHPPQGSPRLWQEPEREFEAIDLELGALARMVFGTTGIEDKIDDSPGDHRQQRRDEAPEDGVPVASLAALGSFAQGGEEVSLGVNDLLANLNGLDVLEAPVAHATELATVPASEHLAPAPYGDPPRKPEPEPDLVTKPLPLTLHGLAAGRGKPVQLFSSAAVGFEVQIPRSAALPLRPLMTLGPAPALTEPARKAVEKKEPERAPVKSGAALTSLGIAARDDSRRPLASRTDVRPETVTVRKLGVPAPQPEIRPLEKRADTRSSGQATPIAKEQPGLKDAPVLKDVPSPVETKPERVKPESRKPTPPEPVSKGGVQEAAKAVAPAEKAWPAPISAPQTSLDLGLPSLNLKKPSGSLWSRIPMAAKIGVAVGVLALAGVIATASIMYFSGRGPQVVDAGPPLPVSGWVKDWDTGPQVQVTVVQGTVNLANYRAQFQAQIDAKAVGWVFRARDPKNYYASKLEVVKSGAIWTAVLARFAVIDGHEEPRVHVPLSLAVQENTVYKVRLEAVGDHFSTWIQDQKVDEFSDGRIPTGGVGLYSERGESALLKGDLTVIPLRIKK